MAIEDQIKWDKKYSETAELLAPREASKNLQEAIQHCQGMKALELACGAGRNTLFLAEQGFEVDALDISSVAITSLDEALVARGLSANTQVEDLDSYTPIKETYDLIVMTNFLDRALIERCKEALKVGGLFFVETYMDDERNEKKESTNAFLLQQEELREIFSEGFFEERYIEEPNEAYERYFMIKQSIVVRKL